MTDLMVTNANMGLITYKNADLQKATNKIFKLGANMRKAAITTAAIIALVDAHKFYEEDGFETVHDWTERTFGFKKSNSYQMLRIGREFVEPVLSETGKIKEYRTNLSDPDAEYDFSVAQVGKMLPLGYFDAKKAVREGLITPEMSCREIDKVVKDLKAIEAESEPAEPADEAETAEPADEAEPVEEVKIIEVTDANGTLYYVPENILMMYKA